MAPFFHQTTAIYEKNVPAKLRSDAQVKPSRLDKIELGLPTQQYFER